MATSINKVLSGKKDSVTSSSGQLTFMFIPGKYTKQKGAEAFLRKRIYCPELNKEFNSQAEAAEYFVSNKIWGSIKLKTAKLRISDVVRGYFPDYKGYTFKQIGD